MEGEGNYRFGRPSLHSDQHEHFKYGRPVHSADCSTEEVKATSQGKVVCQELKNCKYGRPEPTHRASPSSRVDLLTVPPAPRKSLQHPKSPVPVRATRRKGYSEGCTSPDSPGTGITSQLVMSLLERGVLVNLYSHKKKTERMNMCLWGSLGELVFVRSLSSKAFITVKLDEVKEICKDSRQRLSRISEDISSREASDAIITIIHGTGFTLNFVSFSLCTQQDAINFDKLCVGLEVALEKHRHENFYEQREKWFYREFHRLRSIDVASQNSKENKISLKHTQAWFRQHSLQLTKQYLTLVQKKMKLPDLLDVQAFSILVTDVLTTNLVHQIMREYGAPSPDGKSRHMTQDSFKAFLIKEQKDVQLSHADNLDKMLTCFPPDQSRDDNIVFSQRQFENYLFSNGNSILNPVEVRVNQSMDEPLSRYWIASSHNTYLTADQWKGDSSVETYARCLRMGCRCLELDCWDGTDGKPIITHGRSLTSKIRVADVLHTIKEHAWVVTDYPLVLSIENHCSLAQQRILASLFKETFKDELLTDPVDVNEMCLPSPNQLRRKIIIKNKKLQTDGKVIEPRFGVEGMERMDIKKFGMLFIKYATEKKWHNFEFCLGESHLCFSPLCEAIEDEYEEENIKDYFEGDDSDDDMSEEEITLNSNLWYHGCIGRKAAEDAIWQHSSHGDGTFLLRDSDKGGYALSFLCQKTVIHSKIKSRKTEDGTMEYLIGNEVWHNSVPELVDFYKRHKLSFRQNSVCLHLTFPVSMTFDFFDESWYFPYTDRSGAEELLKMTPHNGAFLVRPSSMNNSFSVSFRQNRAISHFQIQYVNKKFVLSNFRFKTMQSLISYFQKHPLYRTVKLSVAASDEYMNGDGDDDMRLYGDDLYTAPQVTRTVTVRALYDFHASSPDELSFKRGSSINNVLIVDEPWWRGDHGGEIQKLFPANYVHVIDEPSDAAEVGKPNEAALLLANCHIESTIQVKDSIHCFMLTHPSQPSTLLIGSATQVEIKDWLHCVLETVDKVNSQTQELQKQERSRNIAQELSDLIVYCQAVPYNPIRQGKFYEISSFSEERIGGKEGKDDQAIIAYNKSQLSRVYPKFLRVSSTNYDPIPKWNLGCQMLALNYQTPDRPMQINQARFLQNGGCGFVLKPEFMQDHVYNPASIRSLLGGIESVVLTVTVLGGRNLNAGGSGMAVSRPFVVVEVLGLPVDSQKERTRITNCDTSLNPVWKNDVFVFHISCPELAFLRFEVFSENNETTFLSQATYPLACVLQGYRSVPMKNSYSESLPLSTLLVHINIKNPREEEEKSLFLIMEETRRLYNELSTSDNDQDEKKRDQLQQTEKKLLEYLDQSKNHGNRRTWVF